MPLKDHEWSYSISGQPIREAPRCIQVPCRAVPPPPHPLPPLDSKWTLLHRRALISRSRGRVFEHGCALGLTCPLWPSSHQHTSIPGSHNKLWAAATAPPPPPPAGPRFSDERKIKSNEAVSARLGTGAEKKEREECRRGAKKWWAHTLALYTDTDVSLSGPGSRCRLSDLFLPLALRGVRLPGYIETFLLFHTFKRAQKLKIRAVNTRSTQRDTFHSPTHYS